MKLRTILGAVLACGCIALSSTASVLLTPSQSEAAVNDFDGDGKSDLVVWRPPTGVWYVYTSSGACPSQMTPVPVYGGCEIQWGLPGDRPHTADFNADGRPDFVVVRPNTMLWYVRYSYVVANSIIQLGLPGDIESLGDVNSDGYAEMVVYRPSNATYYVRIYNPVTGLAPVSTYVNIPWNPAPAGPYGPWVSGSAGTARYSPNTVGDNPGVHGRFYYSGGPTVYGQWFWFDTATNVAHGSNGLIQGQIPAIGNYAGSTLADWSFYNPVLATWGTVPNLAPAGSPWAGLPGTSWGGPTQLPVSGDYDGDGQNDIATWNAATSGTWLATWFIKPSSGTCPLFLASFPGGCYWQWGLPGDVPVTSADHHN